MSAVSMLANITRANMPRPHPCNLDGWVSVYADMCEAKQRGREGKGGVEVRENAVKSCRKKEKG